MVAGFKVARLLANATGIVISPCEVVPGDSVQSDADILTYIQQTMAPIHHAVGTCEEHLPSHMVKF